jgi:hypothetical protein
MECGALAPLSPGDFSPRRTGTDDQTLNGGPDKQVPPTGVGRNANVTSTSLRTVFGGARSSCPVKENGLSNNPGRLSPLRSSANRLLMRLLGRSQGGCIFHVQRHMRVIGISRLRDVARRSSLRRTANQISSRSQHDGPREKREAADGIHPSTWTGLVTRS